MSRAAGWLLIFALIFMMGTHPDALVSLLHQTIAVVGHAGNELSSLVSQL